MMCDVWNQAPQAQQDAWKQCLWLDKTLTGLHPQAQLCLRPAAPPNAKEAKAMLGDHSHKALFSFQRGEQG